jgi:ribonuclease G
LSLGSLGSVNRYVARCRENGSSTVNRRSRYKEAQFGEYAVSEEILINVTPRETRVGVVENGMLQEVHVERASKRGYVGNVYKGRVQRVMPGMQAVFVEIGLERAAFLHASDIVRPPPARPADGVEPATATAVPSISELVHEGQEIVVQVVKDPISTKGARLSAHLSIPSRYLVLLPYARTLGISTRIEDEAERQRLKDVLTPLIGENPLGYIVRTNAEGQSAESLAFDVTYLSKVWRVVQENIAKAKVGERVYEELSLPLRSVARHAQRRHRKVRSIRAKPSKKWSSSCTSSCRAWTTASSTTTASGRSSISTASRTKCSAR